MALEFPAYQLGFIENMSAGWAARTRRWVPLCLPMCGRILAGDDDRSGFLQSRRNSRSKRQKSTVPMAGTFHLHHHAIYHSLFAGGDGSTIIEAVKVCDIIYVMTKRSGQQDTVGQYLCLSGSLYHSRIGSGLLLRYHGCLIMLLILSICVH